MDTETQIVLPGDPIDPAAIPSHKKLPLRLGPGLRLIPPAEIVPTVAGQLVTDKKKNSIWVEHNGGRYIPAVGDLVIGQVHHSSADFYYVSLTPYTAHALLPALAFENASRKTRPVLGPGALVYARVALADKHMDPELECVDPATGKAGGLGPLGSGGMVFSIRPAMARRLLMPPSSSSSSSSSSSRAAPEDGGSGGGNGSGVVVLDLLGAQGLAFETAVGRNGKLWVNSESARTVLLVGRAVTETDEAALDVAAQRKLVKRLLKDKK